MEINNIKTCHLKSGCAYTYFPCFLLLSVVPFFALFCAFIGKPKHNTEVKHSMRWILCIYIFFIFLFFIDNLYFGQLIRAVIVSIINVFHPFLFGDNLDNIYRNMNYCHCQCIWMNLKTVRIL